MFVVDANILLYAFEQSSPLNQQSRSLTENWRRGHERWYLSWGVINEFLRVSTHPQVFTKLWKFITALLATPSLQLLIETDTHAETVAMLSQAVAGLAGNLLFDFHLAALMHEHGVERIYTISLGRGRQSVEVVSSLTVDISVPRVVVMHLGLGWER